MKRISGLSAAHCITLGLVLLLVPLTDAFRALEASDGPPDTKELLDVDRLAPVELPAPVALTGSTDPEAAVAEVAAAVATAAGLPSANLRLSKQETDDLGFTHYRFDQVLPYTGGVARVVGGDMIAHVKAGTELESITGTAVPGVSAQLPPTVGKASARRNQLAHVRGRAPAFAGADLTGTELQVVPTTNRDVVAWCSSADLTRDTDAQGNPRPASLRVCSAGHGNGQVVESRNQLPTVLGTGRTLYAGDVDIDTTAVTGGYALTDPGAGGAKTCDMMQGTSSCRIMNDADNTWGNSSKTDRATAAADAHWGARMTYDYFKTVHGRNGIRNDGQGAVSRVHYSVNYANAYWSDSCFCMTYGDGDSTWSPLVSLDVAGHEMAHGITSVTARLTYSGESGGLNEATSDIFGTLVEWFAANSKDTPDYRIGETIMSNGKALRYMYQPSLDSRSPNCWVKNLKVYDVHYSSGVGNHFFYLLAEGSSPSGQPPSPTCNGQPVTGIGRDSAGKIWYRALTVYMTSNTNYKAARTATISAAKDLYGASSREAAAVASAWTAVSVN